MTQFQLRPTFEIPLATSRRDAITQLQAWTPTSVADANAAHAITFVIKGEYGELRLPVDQWHLWSPHLSISINENAAEPGHPRGHLYGRFAPRMEVWSCVWAVYLMMATITFFSLILVASQAMLGWPLWGGWIAAAALIVIAGVSVSARIGQRLSADQMRDLRTALDEILNDAGVPIQPEGPLESTNATRTSQTFVPVGPV